MILVKDFPTAFYLLMYGALRGFMLGDVTRPTLCDIVAVLLCLAVPYALVPYTFPVYPETRVHHIKPLSHT